MTNPRVVPFPEPHKVKAEGMDMEEMYIGNTRVLVDTSYVDNRTPDQAQKDLMMLREAVWALLDETQEEAV